jgi:hypothetical protein
VNHATTLHAFDILDDSDTSRESVRGILAFLRFHRRDGSEKNRGEIRYLACFPHLARWAPRAARQIPELTGTSAESALR